MKAFLRNIVITILRAEARLTLLKYKPKIIAITGTVGKTSTKDAVFAVVEKVLVARKSTKSFNGKLGVPLTVLGLDNAWANPFLWVQNIIRGLALVITREHYPKWLVLEVGADNPGDIEQVTEWMHPDIAIVTRFGTAPVHVEFFKSPEELFEEKAKLVKALSPAGLLIVNADDEKVLALRSKTKAKSLTYGLSPEAMFRGSNVRIMYSKGKPLGMTFKLEYDGNVFPVTLSGVIGVQSVYSALAALALGVYLKLNIVDMVGALSEHKTPPGRVRIIPGIKGSTILDDTYNSSPVAAMAAVEALSKIKATGKKIAVLGDMLELGKLTVEEHKTLGEHAGNVADCIFAVGPRAKYIAEGALAGKISEKNILQFDNAHEAGKSLENILGEGDIVLIKGSQSIRMERAVEEVMANPEHAGTLLVRQEEEWKAKG
ncbi:MAG: UDP-N-acetylmuramoyl-tripeptide-D-alanyl-D-alanine ligase [Parcubacteria group bacterium GW2011_GWA1_47_8]|nr:MAG: UDP-N-acetylmuramoyl-tripeptide-D-alanyl-D-alanine ligase [Parcubacteria group bacterium GW2011_GWA1_47_8]